MTRFNKGATSKTDHIFLRFVLIQIIKDYGANWL